MFTGLTWQKSSYSAGGDNNACVELAASDGKVHLRESDEPAAVIVTSPDSLRTLIRRLKADVAAAE